jgi:hypothetical protein
MSHIRSSGGHQVSPTSTAYDRRPPATVTAGDLAALSATKAASITRAGASSPEEASIGRLRLGAQVSAKRTGLHLPVGLPLAAWTRVGQHISLLSSSSAWWQGDWIIYGRENFPDRYKRAMEQTSLEYQTLRNYAWVARRFPVSRRRESLSFQHHATVASLPSEQQDRWLDLASSLHWSMAQLRAQVRAASGKAVGQRSQIPAVLQLALASDRRGRWEAAALKQQHDNLADWIMHVIDEMAAHILDSS